MNIFEQWQAFAPYIISFGGLEKAAVVACVIALVIASLIPRRWVAKMRYRAVLALFLIGAALTAVYWEPIAIARQAKYLCANEAGMKVFRTVEARGFLGTSDIESFSKDGFEYVEEDLTLFKKGARFRATMVPTSRPFIREVKRETVDAFISEYEVYRTEVLFLPYAGGNRSIIRVRESGEVLGQTTGLSFQRSRLDALFAPLIESPPLVCNGPEPPSTHPKFEAYTNTLVRAVIKPVRDEHGVK